MSAISNTARAGLAGRLRIPRSLVLLVLVVALGAAAVTAALVASSGSAGGASHHAAGATPQRLYMGGPGEGRGSAGAPSAAPANDRSQHPGRRP